MSKYFLLPAVALSVFVSDLAKASTPSEKVVKAYHDLASAGMVSGASVAVISSDGTGLTFSLGNIHSAQDLLEIGSVSKTFAGIALSNLSIQKKIDIEAPISKYIPELKAAFIGNTTAHLLATHSAQLPDGYTGEDQADEAALIGFLKSYTPTAAYPAGTRQYSNTGFATLSLLISRVSGQSYETYIRNTILIPLQMSKSGFLDTPKNASILVIPHDILLRPTHIDTFGPVEQASGGIYSNADDMNRFVKALLHPEGAASLKDAIILSETLGLGWDSLPGKRPLWKNGGMTGFGSLLEIDTERKQGAFTVVDSNNTLAAMSICDLTLDGAANDQIWNVDHLIAGQSLSSANAFAGTYQTSDRYFEVDVLKISNVYLAIDIKQKGISVSSARLISIGSGKFWVDSGAGLSDRVEFSFNPNSSASGFTYFAKTGTESDGKPIYEKTVFHR